MDTTNHENLLFVKYHKLVLFIKQKLNNIHEGCFLFYRIPLKPTPSLTMEMITVESQVSEHSFNLDSEYHVDCKWCLYM